MMSALETKNPSKPRRRLRWMPDRFELFEVAVLVAVSHILVLEAMSRGWHPEGILLVMVGFVGSMLVLLLAYSLAVAAFRQRYQENDEGPRSLLFFGTVGILNLCAMYFLYPDMTSWIIEVVVAACFGVWVQACWAGGDQPFFHREPDSGLGEDPLKRENKRERGVW